MGRINRDSKFTVYKRQGGNKSEEKLHTYANLKGYMKLPDTADELLSLALQDYKSKERIKIFKDAIWKGPEAKPLLAWAHLIPYSILITCKLKHLHPPIFFLQCDCNESKAGPNITSEMLYTAQKP